MEKCCVDECTNRGELLDGFDFFLCETCLEELERLLNSQWAKNYFAHANN